MPNERRRWLLTAEERYTLKKLSSLNEALYLTYDHIRNLHMLYNTAPSLTEANAHAANIIKAMHEVATQASVP